MKTYVLKKWCPLFFVVVSILFLSGCTTPLFDGSTRYHAQPTSIQYTISYGYNISVVGEGPYTILFECDTPTLLRGTVSSLSFLYPSDYIETVFGENHLVIWNISADSSGSYELGLSATIQAHSFLVSDLNGEAALSLEQIAAYHSELVQQYCKEQSLDDTPYIDPTHPGIRGVASTIRAEASSDNAFILAQAAFVWLKENTQYQIHESDAPVQPASVTYQSRTGDCDDLSFLYISLCRSLGIPARFVRGVLLVDTDGFVQATPHAWAEVFVGGTVGNEGWIPVECAGSASTPAEIHQNFGVESCHHLRQFIDDGSNESLHHSVYGISWTYIPTVEITAQTFYLISSYTILESKQLIITQENIRSFN